MKLYVGNLPWSTTDAELEELFAAIGPVDSARVIEMADGQRAMEELNGKDMGGRALRVNEANEQRPRGGGGGGGGGRY